MLRQSLGTPGKVYCNGLSHSTQSTASSEYGILITRCCGLLRNNSKRRLSLDSERGTLHCAVERTSGNALVAIRSDRSTDGSLVEGGMLKTLGRVFPIESPPRHFRKTHDCAYCSDVDHRSAREMVLILGAYRGRITGK